MKHKYFAAALIALLLTVSLPFAALGQALEYPHHQQLAASDYGNMQAVCPVCGQIGKAIGKDAAQPKYLYQCPNGHKWWK